MQRALAIVCVLLLLPAPELLRAQAGDSDLRIVVLQGAGVTHLANRKNHEKPLVEVRTADGLPVRRAIVTFRAPDSGPGGSFGKRGTVLQVVTGKDGRAEGKNFRPNMLPGEYVIEVNVEHDGRAARTQLKQVNTISAAAAESRKEGAKMAAVWVVLVGVIALVSTVTAMKQVNRR
jgi:hypothetical protein